METTELTLRTGRDRFHDITGELRTAAGEAGGDGLLHVFLPHATAGLALMETAAGSEADLSAVLDELLPRDDRWRHSHGSRGHGADHLLPAFLSPTLTLAVEAGELVLGTWQSVVLVDPNVDNPTRHVQVRLLRGQG